MSDQHIPGPRFLVALSADFQPEDYPGLIEHTYLSLPGGQLGAGLFELRFLRVLSPDESGSPIVALQRAEQSRAVSDSLWRAAPELYRAAQALVSSIAEIDPEQRGCSTIAYSEMLEAIAKASEVPA